MKNGKIMKARIGDGDGKIMKGTATRSKNKTGQFIPLFLLPSLDDSLLHVISKGGREKNNYDYSFGVNYDYM